MGLRGSSGLGLDTVAVAAVDWKMGEVDMGFARVDGRRIELRRRSVCV